MWKTWLAVVRTYSHLLADGKIASRLYFDWDEFKWRWDLEWPLVLITSELGGGEGLIQTRPHSSRRRKPDHHSQAIVSHSASEFRSLLGILAKMASHFFFFVLRLHTRLFFSSFVVPRLKPFQGNAIFAFLPKPRSNFSFSFTFSVLFDLSGPENRTSSFLSHYLFHLKMSQCVATSRRQRKYWSAH